MYDATYNFLFGKDFDFSNDYPDVLLEFAMNSSTIHTDVAEHMAGEIWFPVFEENFFKAMSRDGKYDIEFATYISKVLTHYNINHIREERRIWLDAGKEWGPEYFTS